MDTRLSRHVANVHAMYLRDPTHSREWLRRLRRLNEIVALVPWDVSAAKAMCYVRYGLLRSEDWNAYAYVFQTTVVAVPWDVVEKEYASDKE